MLFMKIANKSADEAKPWADSKYALFLQDIGLSLVIQQLKIKDSRRHTVGNNCKPSAHPKSTLKLDEQTTMTPPGSLQK